MEPLDDKELNQLLRKWEAPAAPAGMRIPRTSRQSLWKQLWSGGIRVPIPVGAAIIFGVIAFWIFSSRTVQAPIATPAGNAIVSPPSPQPSANPPAATAPIEQPSPSVGVDEKAATALSGFQPVQQLELKIVRVQP